RETPATWADVTRPDRDAVFHFRGRDYQVFGEVWVDKNGGVREPVPGEQPPKGSVRRILLMDWKGRGATFIRSTITPSLRQVERGVRSDVKGLAAVAARLVERHAKRGERGFNRGVQTLLRNTIPVDGNFRLVAPRELLDITVRKGGWFGRASRARAADMTELLDRFAGGMRNLQLSPFPLGNFFAKAGRLASYMKLAFNVPAAVNVWFSAMIQNSTTQPPKQLAESTLAAIEFYGRLFAARNAPIDLAELQKESGFTFGRSKMGSTAEQLKGLTGEALEKRLLYDEAFQELYRHPLFEAKFSDLARRMFVPATKEARGQAAEQLRAMFGKAKSKGAEFWKAATKFTGMEPIAAADHFARTVDFLGSYFSLRRAGESRAEASRRATMNVVRNHGIFNQVTRSRLIGSTFGQFAFGRQTYIMRQFDIWTRMPAEYRLRYASIALGSNYLWRALGIGDLTNQLGFSAYEIPLVGDAMEVLGLGDDDPGLEDELQHSGFVPVPLSVQGGPGMQAIGAAIRTLQGLAEGRPVGRDVMRGVESLFEPAVLAQWQRAFGTQRSDAGFEYTPCSQEFAGSERTSYTLEQRGLAQYLRDLLPGTQPEVHRETEAGAIMRATDKRVAGRRRAVSEEARGVLRRFD